MFKEIGVIYHQTEKAFLFRCTADNTTESYPNRPNQAVRWIPFNCANIEDTQEDLVDAVYGSLPIVKIWIRQTDWFNLYTGWQTLEQFRKTDKQYKDMKKKRYIRQPIPKLNILYQMFGIDPNNVPDFDHCLMCKKEKENSEPVCLFCAEIMEWDLDSKKENKQKEKKNTIILLEPKEEIKQTKKTLVDFL